MDLTVVDWLVSTEDSDVGDAGRLAEAGAVILRAEPHLSGVVEAECHVRLAMLQARGDNPDLAARHAAHAGSLLIDAPTEVQLHTLPRVVALLRSCAATMPDVSPSIADALARSEETVAAAVRASIEAADQSLVRYAVLATIADAVEAGDRRSRIEQAIAAVALDLESAGEHALAAEAAEWAAVTG